MDAYQLGNRGLPKNAPKVFLTIVMFGFLAALIAAVYIQTVILRALPDLPGHVVMYNILSTLCIAEGGRMACVSLIRRYEEMKYRQFKEAWQELSAKNKKTPEIIARVNDGREKIAEIVAAEERDLRFLSLMLTSIRLDKSLKRLLPHYRR